MEESMKMKDVIARINELAHKAKSQALTAEDSVKANLEGQLSNTYLLRPDGTKQKVEKKK